MVIEPEPRHILRWEDEEVDHPVIDELRTHPGRWAVVWEDSNPRPAGWEEAQKACRAHPRVETLPRIWGGTIRGFNARWIPDDEWWKR